MKQEPDYPQKVGTISKLFFPAKSGANVAAIIIESDRLTIGSRISFSKPCDTAECLEISSMQIYGQPVTVATTGQMCGVCLKDLHPQIGDEVWLTDSPPEPQQVVRYHGRTAY